MKAGNGFSSDNAGDGPHEEAGRRRSNRGPSQVPARLKDASGDKNIFYVSEIRGHKVDLASNTMLYKVGWEGYGSEGDTWEDEDNLAGSEELVGKYVRALSREERSDIAQMRKNSATKQRLKKRKQSGGASDKAGVLDGSKQVKKGRNGPEKKMS